MNTIAFIVQQTMLFSIPLLIVALGGMYSERSGVINIGLDGGMIMGAFTGTVFINAMQGSMSGQGLYVLALLIAGLTGLIFVIFHAFASINLKANQVISGTAMNMFAPAFAVFAGRLIFGTQQVPFRDTFFIRSIPLLGDIPIIGPLLFQRCYISTFIGIFIFFIAWFVIQRTPFGLRLRACGEHPGAADTVGIDVQKMRWAGTLISGFLAGLGGLAFVVPTSTESNATVYGYGFLALAVLIFGQWRSFKILGASFFFGLMKTIAPAYSAIPGIKELPIPATVYKMIPYLATLIVLIFMSKRSQAPAAEGIPYEKTGR